MNEVMTEAAVWKESVLIYLDNGYSRGESVDAIVAEIKTIVQDTELGAMNYSIDQIVTEWKADRGLV